MTRSEKTIAALERVAKRIDGPMWTAARIKLLKQLWADPGQSARLIAARLGVTRNAVIGKADGTIPEGPA